MNPAPPRVRIVSPALAAANNGNWHTAARWQRFLSPVAQVDVGLDWQGEPADALIALHARRSADAIARWHAAHGTALAVVLTGTDLYRDLAQGDERAHRSLACATDIVVLQPEALRPLDASLRAKARCILQSAEPRRAAREDGAPFVAVGHLRDEKDPLTLMQAARLLPADAPIRIEHIGNPLDESLAEQARRTAAERPHYRWLGGLPPDATRERIAGAKALVHMSRMEGGANVVIEAVSSGVPVLASRIDGNVGLLGAGYDGYFPVGDAVALAGLMQRFVAEPAWAAHLEAQCAARAPLFAPAREAADVRQLVADLLAGPDRATMPG